MRSGSSRSARDPVFGDPPLIDRLLWREPIRADKLISEDGGLAARTFGTFFLLGALFDVVLFAVSRDMFRSEAGAAFSALAALAFGVFCFVLYRRVNVAWVHVLLIGATTIVAALQMSAVTGAAAVYLPFYTWIGLVAALFLRPRAAASQALLVLAAMVAVMALRDPPYAFEYTLAAGSVMATSSLAVGILRQRTEHLAADLASQAHTDSLTSLSNRRGFDVRFGLEVDRALRDEKPLSLIVCDLDHFKAVNDEMGHEEGDVALRRAAGVIAGSVRSVDAVSRIGGEEFAVLLPGASPDEAVAVAERMRTGIGAEFRGYPVGLTASCGIASSERVVDGDPRTLFTAADAALYRAKRAGRNCSVFYSPEGEEGASAEASSTK
jgi:diguanylate cyclase (GGDEF)-like protein